MAVDVGQLEARDDLPEPGPPGPGDVLVRTAVSAVSPGSELRVLFDPETPFPVAGGTGYMAAGIVEAIGEAVAGLQPGDRVACTAAGPHRERLSARAEAVAHVPDGLGWAEAACAYWIVPPYRGLLAARPRLWEDAAVIGLGPLGLCAVQLLHGISRRTLAVDPLPSRRGLAARLGACAASSPDDAERAGADLLPNGADVVIELSGTQAGLELALRLAAPRARVAVIGVLPRLSNFELFRPLQDRGITLVPLYREGAALTGNPPDPTARYLAAALDMVAARRVDVCSLVSRVMPWRAAPEGIAWLREHPDEGVGLAFTWLDGAATAA
ncbi:MAG: zinc-binding alcohol dehydrogenase [Chloroflexi bacterium]|nr:zinc-binding alcohol dehydrogenase [Chloroflexota bacterium]